MWTNIIEWTRPHMTIWRIRLSCWIPKATNTQSEYVIITAFPQQLWLHERASILRYTYIACLVYRRSDTLKSIFPNSGHLCTKFWWECEGPKWLTKGCFIFRHTCHVFKFLNIISNFILISVSTADMSFKTVLVKWPPAF